MAMATAAVISATPAGQHQVSHRVERCTAKDPHTVLREQADAAQQRGHGEYQLVAAKAQCGKDEMRGTEAGQQRQQRQQIDPAHRIAVLGAGAKQHQKAQRDGHQGPEQQLTLGGALLPAIG
jgi:hypothetical protein